jgi:Arc/MetJ-type ribon-helix-helix transcriptional regulator
MKIGVSLPDEDIRFLDEYAAAEGIASRSAVLHRAVRLLQSDVLSTAYEGAWQGWVRSMDHRLWDSTVADGLDD